MEKSAELIIKRVQCSANINNPNCSRNNLRNLSSSLIEKIHSWGFDHQLDVTMRICESCRGILVHNRTPLPKKRRSDGKESSHARKFEEPQPSTSHQQSEHQEFDDTLGK